MYVHTQFIETNQRDRMANKKGSRRKSLDKLRVPMNMSVKPATKSLIDAWSDSRGVCVDNLVKCSYTFTKGGLPSERVGMILSHFLKSNGTDMVTTINLLTKLKKELQKREIESRESIEAISKYHQVEVI